MLAARPCARVQDALHPLTMYSPRGSPSQRHGRLARAPGRQRRRRPPPAARGGAGLAGRQQARPACQQRHGTELDLRPSWALRLRRSWSSRSVCGYNTEAPGCSVMSKHTRKNWAKNGRRGRRDCGHKCRRRRGAGSALRFCPFHALLALLALHGSPADCATPRCKHTSMPVTAAPAAVSKAAGQRGGGGRCGGAAAGNKKEPLLLRYAPWLKWLSV